MALNIRVTSLTTALQCANLQTNTFFRKTGDLSSQNLANIEHNTGKNEARDPAKPDPLSKENQILSPKPAETLRYEGTLRGGRVGQQPKRTYKSLWIRACIDLKKSTISLV